MQQAGHRPCVEVAPDAGDLALLEERVAAAAGIAAGGVEQEFGVFVRGADAEVLAGVSGVVLGACCELQALWVTESLRHRGLARALMAAAEAEARQRGCEVVMLHAYDVLTDGLYERLGYRTVGVIDGCLGGGALRWYAKRV